MTLARPRLSLTAAAATRLLDNAEAAARALGVDVVIVVVNESGLVMGLRRMDHAPLLSSTIAEDKAYTAASFGLPTRDWYDRLEQEPALLHGLAKTARFIIFAGGVPLIEDGVVVGGIGVSGGTADQDDAIATAALPSSAAG